MYTFGYLFQKRHFQGPLKKKGALTKNFREADDPPAPPLQETSGLYEDPGSYDDPGPYQDLEFFDDPGKTQEIINKLKFLDFHIMCLIWWNLQLKTDLFIIVEWR